MVSGRPGDGRQGSVAACGTLWNMQRTNRTEVLRVRVRQDEREALEAIATREDLPLSTVLRRALRTYVEGREGTRSTGRTTRKQRSAK
jgi:hypothetical protein